MEARLLLLNILCFMCITRTASQKCPTDAAADGSFWTIYYKLNGKLEAKVIYAATPGEWKDAANLDQLKAMAETAIGKKDISVIGYSNFPPKFRSTVECGSAAKGILAWKGADDYGWYLLHTVDRWPDFSAYADPDQEKAALFVCVSVPAGQFPDVGRVLDYQDPIIYFYNSEEPAVTGKDLNSITELKALTEPPKPRYTPYVKSIQFKVDTVNVRFISKLPLVVTDIYSSYLNVLLKRDLLVWSKPKSNKLLNSSCTTTYKVENVKPVEITVKDVPIKRDDDSSRWAVSKTGPYFCAGNADRTESGKTVGTGIVCLQQADVAKLFRPIANKAKLEACS